MVKLCLQTLHSGSGGLVPFLAVKDVLVLVDSDQAVAGHGRQPNVAGLVLKHLVVDSLNLLVLPGSHTGAGKGLLDGGPVLYVGVVALSVVGLLVALPGVHSPGRVHKMRSHGGDVIKHSFDYRSSDLASLCLRKQMNTSQTARACRGPWA